MTVVLDRSKIKTVGKEAIGKFLGILQAYKSTADSEALFAFYNTVSLSINRRDFENLLELQDKDLERTERQDARHNLAGDWLQMR